MHDQPDFRTAPLLVLRYLAEGRSSTATALAGGCKEVALAFGQQEPSMNQFVIRAAGYKDLSALSILFVDLDDYHFKLRPNDFRCLDGPARSKEMIAEMLSADDAVILVAEDCLSGRLLGLAHLLKREFPETLVAPRRVVCEMDALVVSADHRRRGIGSRLLLEAHRWANGRGLPALELNVREFNQAALSFYESLGFGGMSRRLTKQVQGGS